MNVILNGKGLPINLWSTISQSYKVVVIKKNNNNNWRAKQALIGMGIYIMCRMSFITWEFTKDFRTRLKKGMGRLRKQAMEGRKQLQIQSPKERTLDIHATYMVNSYQGKVAEVIL